MLLEKDNLCDLISETFFKPNLKMELQHLNTIFSTCPFFPFYSFTPKQETTSSPCSSFRAFPPTLSEHTVAILCCFAYHPASLVISNTAGRPLVSIPESAGGTKEKARKSKQRGENNSKGREGKEAKVGK